MTSSASLPRRSSFTKRVLWRRSRTAKVCQWSGAVCSKSWLNNQRDRRPFHWGGFCMCPSLGVTSSPSDRWHWQPYWCSRTLWVAHLGVVEDACYFFEFNPASGLYEMKATGCAGHAERAVVTSLPRRDIIKAQVKAQGSPSTRTPHRAHHQKNGQRDRHRTDERSRATVRSATRRRFSVASCRKRQKPLQRSARSCSTSTWPDQWTWPASVTARTP